MTKEESELVSLIRDTTDQSQAILVAVSVILSFLGQPQPYQEQVAVVPLVHD